MRIAGPFLLRLSFPETIPRFRRQTASNRANSGLPVSKDSRPGGHPNKWPYRCESGDPLAGLIQQLRRPLGAARTEP